MRAKGRDFGGGWRGDSGYSLVAAASLNVQSTQEASTLGGWSRGNICQPSARLRAGFNVHQLGVAKAILVPREGRATLLKNLNRSTKEKDTI